MSAIRTIVAVWLGVNGCAAAAAVIIDVCRRRRSRSRQVDAILREAQRQAFELKCANLRGAAYMPPLFHSKCPLWFENEHGSAL